MTPAPEKICAELLRLAAERGARATTFCPSEAARNLARDAGADWRPWMPAIREAAQQLVDNGQLHCTQRGRAAQPATARGPIRLSAPRSE